jgi:hypothetical protein
MPEVHKPTLERKCRISRKPKLGCNYQPGDLGFFIAMNMSFSSYEGILDGQLKSQCARINSYF